MMWTCIRWLTWLIFALFFFGLGVGLANAATYWTNQTSGSDGNGCNSSASPLTTTAKASIAAGIGCLSAGDTLMIRAGTYIEAINDTLPSGLNSSAKTTIQAYNGEHVVWRTGITSTTSTTPVLNIVANSNIIIGPDIHFENNGTRSVIIVRQSTSNACDKNSNTITGITITGNAFTNNGHCGYANNCAGTPSSVNLSRIIHFICTGDLTATRDNPQNEISENTFDGNYGRNIALAGASRTLVEKNILRNMHYAAVNTTPQFKSQPISLTEEIGVNNNRYNTIRYNKIHGTVVANDSYIGSNPAFAYCVILDVNADDNLIAYNECYDIDAISAKTGTGIMSESRCDRNIILGNIVYRVGDIPLRVGSSGTTVAVDNQVIGNSTHGGLCGLSLAHAASAIVKNNTLAFATRAQLYVSPKSIAEGGHTISHNLYWKTASAAPNLWNDTGSQTDPCPSATNDSFANWNTQASDTHSVNDDPDYANTSSGSEDFTLQVGSPAIDVGTTVTGVVSSSTGSGVDMGALRDPPTLVSCEVGNVADNVVVSTWAALSSLSSATNASLPVTVGGSSATVNSADLNSTSQVYHTLQTAVQPGQAVTVACSQYGCVEDSANIGNTLDAKARTFAAVSCTNNVSGGSGGDQIPEVQAFAYTNGTPAVDDSRTEWENVPTRTVTTANALVDGTITNDADLSGVLQLLWDATYLYLRFQATDDITQVDSGTQYWRDDSLGVYLDGNKDSTGEWGADDLRIFVVQDGTVAVFNGTCATHSVDVNTSGTNYDIEMRIPYSCFGNITPEAGDLIGFDIEFSDDDNGGGREGFMMLSNVKHDGTTANLIDLRFESQQIDLGQAPAAPILNDIQVGSITSSGATVTWTTNVNATGNVDYGTTQSYGTSRPDPADETQDNTSHSVSLTSLDASTLYNVRVRSSNGTEATSANFTFTTLAAAAQPTWTTPYSRLECLKGSESGACVYSTLTLKPNGGARARFTLAVADADPEDEGVALCVSVDQAAFARVTDTCGDLCFWGEDSTLGVETGEATTERLTNAGTFTAGAIRLTNGTISKNFAQGGASEFLFAIKTGADIVGKEIRLALCRNNGTLFAPDGPFLTLTGTAATASRSGGIGLR